MFWSTVGMMKLDKVRKEINQKNKKEYLFEFLWYLYFFENLLTY
jgi:hypothetical protein